MSLSLFHLCLVLKMNELKSEHEQDPCPPVGSPQITQRFCARAVALEPGARLHQGFGLSASPGLVSFLGGKLL